MGTSRAPAGAPRDPSSNWEPRRGADFKYLTEPEELLRCGMCRSAFFDPVETENEQYFCRVCIDEHILAQGHVCPTSGVPLSHHAPYRPVTRALRELVDRLVVVPACPSAARDVRKPFPRREWPAAVAQVADAIATRKEEARKVEEARKAEEARKEQARKEEARKAEEARKEQARKEEARKAEDARKEQARKEEARKAEEARKEQHRKEELRKVEEAKKEQARKEEERAAAARKAEEERKCAAAVAAMQDELPPSPGLRPSTDEPSMEASQSPTQPATEPSMDVDDSLPRAESTSLERVDSSGPAPAMLFAHRAPPPVADLFLSGTDMLQSNDDADTESPPEPPNVDVEMRPASPLGPRSPPQLGARTRQRSPTISSPPDAPQRKSGGRAPQHNEVSPPPPNRAVPVAEQRSPTPPSAAAPPPSAAPPPREVPAAEARRRPRTATTGANVPATHVKVDELARKFKDNMNEEELARKQAHQDAKERAQRRAAKVPAPAAVSPPPTRMTSPPVAMRSATAPAVPTPPRYDAPPTQPAVDDPQDKRWAPTRNPAAASTADGVWAPPGWTAPAAEPRAQRDRAPPRPRAATTAATRTPPVEHSDPVAAPAPQPQGRRSGGERQRSHSHNKKGTEPVPTGAREKPTASTDDAPGRRLKMLGDTAYEKGDYREAIRQWSQAIATGDGSVRPDVVLGNRSAAHFMCGAYKQCIDDCRAALQHDQGNPKLWQRMGKASAMMGSLSQAKEFLRHASQLPPREGRDLQQKDAKVLDAVGREIKEVNNASEAIAAAVRRTTSGDGAGAARELAGAVRRGSGWADWPEVTAAVAEAHLQAGAYDAAASEAGKVCARPKPLSLDNAVAARIFITRTKALFGKGYDRLKDAIQTATDGVMFMPHNQELKQLRSTATSLEERKERGNKHFKDKDWKGAEACYTDGIRIAGEALPEVAKVLFTNRAAARKELRQYAAAAADCTSAIAIDTSFAKAYTRRGRCHMEMCDFDKAAADFRTAVQHTTGAIPKDLQDNLRDAERRRDAKEADFYALLGVKQNFDEDQLKKKYKQLCMKWHPDRHVGEPDEVKDEAERKFKQIQEAYNTLTSPQKRREYDRKQARQRDPYDRPFGGAGFGWDNYRGAAAHPYTRNAGQQHQQWRGYTNFAQGSFV